MMRKILFILAAAFFFSSCEKNVYDKTIEMYEDAAEKIQSADDKVALRQVERELNAEYSRLLHECSAEFAELEQKVAAGDRTAVQQFEKVKEAKRLYWESKRIRKKEMGK